MVYKVEFDPTEEHYDAMKKLGRAEKRSKYPIVAGENFRSPEEAERFIESMGTMPGWSRKSYRIIKEP